MKNISPVNLMLVGLGPHAKRIYYPLLELHIHDSQLNLCVAVEKLSTQIDTEKFLGEQSIKPEVIYIEDKDNPLAELPPEVQRTLNTAVKKHHINGVIIATEPLAHVQYAKWALEAGLSILMDKPISSYEDISTSPDKAQRLIDDYHKLHQIYQFKRKEYPRLVFSMMAQRRYQTSFNLIKQRIAECFAQTHCPVTNIQSFHSDGQWRMPTEIVEQHYHPYNQGYGKCSHSGYHYFDIVPFILDSGYDLHKHFDNIDVFAQSVRPGDVLYQFGLDDYRTLFGQSEFDSVNQYDQTQLNNLLHRFGEVDCACNLLFKNEDRILTSASINLCHNGYSLRNWVTAKGRDLYKGNGRVAHESHIIIQGPFQSIYFQSYKSDESPSSVDSSRHPPGSKEHIEIIIFRNYKMLGGQHVESFDIEDLIAMEGGKKGLTGKAKAKAFYEFIAGMRGEISPCQMVSDFSKHEIGAVITSAVYQSISNRFCKKNPLINYAFSQVPTHCRDSPL